MAGGEDLVVTNGADGRLVVFAPGRFMSVLQTWEQGPSGEWAPWTEVPLSWGSPPAVVGGGEGRLELFGASTDAIEHVWQTSPDGAWSRVEVLFGVRPRGRSAAARNEDGRIEVFVCGDRGEIEHNWQREPNGEWVTTAGRWPSLQGLVAAGDPELVVARNADGRLELFARGAGGDTHHVAQRYPNGGFGAWHSVGARSPGMPAVAADTDGRLEVFTLAAGGYLLRAVQLESGEGFEPWEVLGTGWPGSPAVGTNADGRLHVFARGPDRALYHSAQSGPGGSFDRWLSLGGSWDADPVVGRAADG